MSVESTVYDLLVSRQEYSPVDLLMAEGLLSETLHRAWRIGDIPNLDEAFEDAGGIRALLGAASSFAKAFGLVSERVAYHGLEDHSEHRLTASFDPLLNDLLECRFRPERRPENSHQGDLFLDGGKVESTNALVHALLARDSDLARDALERVADLIPDYKYLAHAEKLIAALERSPPKSPVDGFESLERMQRDWYPAAREYLGNPRAHIVLAPLWLDIGRALGPSRFDPDHPDRHASYAFEQARDWQRLRESVLAVPDFRMRPVLLARLARAESRLANRTAALERWLAMCLLSPDDFCMLVESSNFEDPGIARAWQLAVSEDDVDEELTAEWFPAWMLIHEPGLARALPDMAGGSAPETAFNVARALLLMREEKLGQADPRSIPLRSELNRIRPSLLRSYHKKRSEEDRTSPPVFDDEPFPT